MRGRDLHPDARGFAYLVAVMDWKTRAVLSWKLSNTLDATFCLAALREALDGAGGAPEIFNTGQGSQFTNRAWIEALENAGVKVSMDGKGRNCRKCFVEGFRSGFWSISCKAMAIASPTVSFPV